MHNFILAIYHTCNQFLGSNKMYPIDRFSVGGATFLVRTIFAGTTFNVD